MTAAGAMDERIADALKSLKSEGHIDDQFEQLLLLQDDSDPDFVKSVMQLFFEVRRRAAAAPLCWRGRPRERLRIQLHSWLACGVL